MRCYLSITHSWNLVDDNTYRRWLVLFSPIGSNTINNNESQNGVKQHWQKEVW